MDNFWELLKNLDHEGIQLPTKQIEEKINKIQVEGEAGGGWVRVKMNGMYKVLTFHIEDNLLQKDKKQILEDLLAAAINHAVDKVREATKDLAYGSFMDTFQSVLEKIPSQDS